MAERLFVYGTLRKGSNHEMARWLARQARWIDRGTVRGRLYRIGSYPGLVVNPAGSAVVGDLFALPEEGAETLLSALDAYEECTPAFPQPHEYARVGISVETGSGEHRHAWTYIYLHPTADLEPIAGGDFLRGT